MKICQISEVAVNKIVSSVEVVEVTVNPISDKIEISEVIINKVGCAGHAV